MFETKVRRAEERGPHEVACRIDVHALELESLRDAARGVPEDRVFEERHASAVFGLFYSVFTGYCYISFQTLEVFFCR